MANLKRQVLDLAVDICAHAELDWEITLAGNGTNASEACNVARELFSFLNIEKSEVEPLIAQRIDLLEKHHGAPPKKNDVSGTNLPDVTDEEDEDPFPEDDDLG